MWCGDLLDYEWVPDCGGEQSKGILCFIIECVGDLIDADGAHMLLLRGDERYK